MSHTMDKEFRADLHVHTCCSDGSDTPEEILYKAKEIGLMGLSFTDHDTTSAYTPEVFTLAKKLKIHLLPGVEISSKQDKEDVHILGYGFSLENPSFQSFLQKIREKRKKRNIAILAKLAEKGIHISEEELYSLPTKVVGRPHIAFFLQKKEVVSSFQEAFDKYLKEGASCYVIGDKFTSEEVIGYIHAAGGKAILAHPHFLKKRKIKEALFSLPFDGVECYYAYFPLHVEKIWLSLAEKKKWITSGGSDYHGSVKPQNLLGGSWVGWESFQRLL